MLVLAAALAPHDAAAQEQGQPRGVPPSAEYAELYFQTGSYVVLVDVMTACPEESEWHRNLLTRLMAPERMSQVAPSGSTAFRSLFEKGCDWPPVRRWFRDALMVTTDGPTLAGLARGVAESWGEGDVEVMVRFAQRADVEEREKGGILNAVQGPMPPEDKVDLFFDLFEAGALTPGYVSHSMALIPFREATADVFARRGAMSVVEHGDRPYATRILDVLGQGVRHGRGVSRAGAAAVLQAFNQLGDRPGFSGIVAKHRAAVARAARGG
jgi:hypothetical protein